MRGTPIRIPQSHPSSLKNSPQTPKHRPFSLLTSTRARRRCDDSIRQTRERQTLKPDLAVTSKRRQKKSFTTKEHRLEVTGALDVVVHSRRHGNQATRIDTQRLAMQFAFDDGAARVYEAEPVADKPLKNEAFATEEASAEFFGEGDAELRAERRAEKRLLLADDLPAQLRQVERDDLARVGRRERDFALLLTGVLKMGHEERLARDGALARIEYLAEETLVGL
jgi:hypothetical protein